MFIYYCWEMKPKSLQPSLVNTKWDMWPAGCEFDTLGTRVYQRASIEQTFISFHFLQYFLKESLFFCFPSVLRNRHFINFICPFFSPSLMITRDEVHFQLMKEKKNIKFIGRSCFSIFQLNHKLAFFSFFFFCYTDLEYYLTDFSWVCFTFPMPDSLT